MKIALFGNPYPNPLHAQVKHLLRMVADRNMGVAILSDFAEHLRRSGHLDGTYETYTKQTLNIRDFACLVSIGGDGTLLETVLMIGDSGVPVVGRTWRV